MHTTRNTAADGKTSEIAATLRAAKRKRRENRPAAGRTRLHPQGTREESEKEIGKVQKRKGRSILKTLKCYWVPLSRASRQRTPGKPKRKWRTVLVKMKMTENLN